MLQLTSTDGDLATRKTRLVAVLMQLWTFIDHFHPDTEHNVNWKAALVEAFPKVSADISNDEFALVITTMLAHLNDPATRLWVNGEDPANVEFLSDCPPTAELLPEGVWLLKIHSGKVFKGNRDEAIIALSKLADSVADCSKLVIDLRGIAGDADCKLVREAFEASSLSHALSDKHLIQPRPSVRYYHGLVPAKGTTTGGYTKFRKPTEPKSFRPLNKSAAKRVVFIVNQHSHLPIVGIALQFAGLAYIIGDGPVRGFIGNRAETIVIPGLGLVDVRLSEVGGNKASQGGFRVNETVQSTGGSDLALQRAMVRVVDNDKNENRYPKVSVGKFKRTTTRKAFPNELERALAAVRIWFMFSFFFPYKHLMDKDWDQVLLDYLPVFDQCRDALDYVQAVARMTAHVQDSHVWIMSADLDRFLRPPVEPFGCRLIEGKAVVTWLGQAAEESGLRIGDVILRVDGEDVFECMQRFSPFICSSTPQYQSFRLLGTIFRGDDGSTISLDVLEGAIQKKIVFCRKSGAAVRHEVGVGCGDVVRTLDGNIGYVDLTRLQVNEVNGMFEKLRQTKGIIFDMRGYPRRTAWAIAPRLVERSKAYSAKDGRIVQTPVPAAHFITPVNPPEEGVLFPGWRPFNQNIPWSSEWRYEGKTVMLIDERAISQAEHTGLFLKAANGTVFIGSPTAGANGDITNFSLPGGIAVALTGQAVEYPDGRQLQRVGLIPDICVAPTIDGIRLGNDEVLERAIEYFWIGLKPLVSDEGRK